MQLKPCCSNRPNPQKLAHDNPVPTSSRLSHPLEPGQEYFTATTSTTSDDGSSLGLERHHVCSAAITPAVISGSPNYAYHQHYRHAASARSSEHPSSPSSRDSHHTPLLQRAQPGRTWHRHSCHTQCDIHQCPGHNHNLDEARASTTPTHGNQHKHYYDSAITVNLFQLCVLVANVFLLAYLLFHLLNTCLKCIRRFHLGLQLHRMPTNSTAAKSLREGPQLRNSRKTFNKQRRYKPNSAAVFEDNCKTVDVPLNTADKKKSVIRNNNHDQQGVGKQPVTKKRQSKRAREREKQNLNNKVNKNSDQPESHQVESQRRAVAQSPSHQRGQHQNNTNNNQQQQQQQQQQKHAAVGPSVESGRKRDHRRPFTEDISYARMRVIESPNVFVADIFRAFLAPSREGHEIFQILVEFADSVGATFVKFLLNDKVYASESLINREYSTYQGPALYVYFDKQFQDSDWEEIFSLRKNSENQECGRVTSHFRSLFHVSDFIVISSGNRIAFIDPSERLSSEERSFVALFDKEKDASEIRLLTDQFRPLMEGPLLNGLHSTRGTALRLPLRCHRHSTNIAEGLFSLDDLTRKAIDFSNTLAERYLLFSKSLVSISAYRAVELSGIAHEQLFLWELNESLSNEASKKGLDTGLQTRYFRYRRLGRTDDASLNQEVWESNLSLVRVSGSTSDGNYHQRDWTLTFYSLKHMTLSGSQFAMQFATPLCNSQENRLYNSDTPRHGLLADVRDFHFNQRPVIIRLVKSNREFQQEFRSVQLVSALKMIQFEKAYALICRELADLVDMRNPGYRTLSDEQQRSRKRGIGLKISVESVWSMMPSDEEANRPAFTNLVAAIYDDLAGHEVFYSLTEGWGFIGVADMIVNNLQCAKLKTLVTEVMTRCNAPVVEIPKRISNNVLKYLTGNGEDQDQQSSSAVARSTSSRHSQLVTPQVLSDHMKRNADCLNEISWDDKMLLLEFLLLGVQSADNCQSSGQSPHQLVIGIRLLPLANGEFAEFVSLPPDSGQATDEGVCEESRVYYVEPQYHSLFCNVEDRLLSHRIPTTILNILCSEAFTEGTQIQTMANSDFSKTIMLPNEWKLGDPCIKWPKNHDRYNLLWLESTWKYIRDKMSTDLSPIENYNLLYVSNQRERYITLYRLSLNDSMLLYCTKDQLVDPLYGALQRILLKIDITVVDGFPDLITGHADFARYVPRFSPTGLIKILRRKLDHSSSSAMKFSQEINSILSQKEVAQLRTFLSKINHVELSTSVLDCMRHLPILENATVEARDKFISLTSSTQICYENGPYLPSLTSPSAALQHHSNLTMRPSVIVTDQDTKLLLEKMGHRIVEFNVAARQLIMCLPDNRTLSGIGVQIAGLASKLGKWLLAHCGGLILTESACQDCVRPLKVFPNQALDLRMANQLIDPMSAERYSQILTSRMLPATDLCNERSLGLLRALGMRTIEEIKADELVELCECARAGSDQRRRLLAMLLTEVLCSNNGKTLLHEPVTVNSGTRCVLKAYLFSVPWVPITQKRPQNYPRSLPWKGATDSACLFVAPHDAICRKQAMIGGSEVFVADLDVRIDQISKFTFKECGADVLVRHLKNVVRSCTHMYDRSEYLEYMNIARECYDTLQRLDPILIQAELKGAGLEEWIWNGVGGFSSPLSLYLLDTSSIIAEFFRTVPYEMYAFTEFFARMGVRNAPRPQNIIGLLNEKTFVHTIGQKTKEEHASLLKWLRETYADRRVQSVVNEVEDLLKEQSITESSNGPQVPGHPRPDRWNMSTSTSSTSSEQTQSQTVVVLIPPSMDQNGIRDAVRSAMESIIKDKTIRVVSSLNDLEHSTQAYLDHYKVYDEYLLPNLNVLSRNMKDMLVLLALDNCDVKMIPILSKHLCIPVTPNGHTLRRPNKLIHPKCLLSLMFSDVEGYFPYGSTDTYLREDRLNVLKLLGMKSEEVSWLELAERAEMVSKVKDAGMAYQKAIGVIMVLRSMAVRLVLSSKKSGDITSSAVHISDVTKQAMQRISDCAFYPVMSRPSQSFPLVWAGDRMVRPAGCRLAKPSALVSEKFWMLTCCSYPIALCDIQSPVTGRNDLITEATILNFHQPTVADALHQLSEISKIRTPLTEDQLFDGYIRQITHSCYSFIVEQSKNPGFNPAAVRDFFFRHPVLLRGHQLYKSSQIFVELRHSILPYFLSLMDSDLPSSLLRDVLAIKNLPEIDHVITILRELKSSSPSDTGGSRANFDRTVTLRLLSLLAEMVEKCKDCSNIPMDLPILAVDEMLHPLSSFKSSTNPRKAHREVDIRLLKLLEIRIDSDQLNDGSNTQGIIMSDPDVEKLLNRIDHPNIDSRLRDALFTDLDGTISLEFILAADKVHPICTSYSFQQANILLGYFNNHLRAKAGNFQKLREVPLFRSVWNDKGLSDSLTPIDKYKQVFLVSERTAFVLKDVFDSCPVLQSTSNQPNANDYGCCVLIGGKFPKEESINQPIWAHLHVIALPDIDAFLQICLPYLSYRCSPSKQCNALRYARDQLWSELNEHEQLRVLEIMEMRMAMSNRIGVPTPITSLYDPNFVNRLSSFIDIQNELPHDDVQSICNFLPLRKYLPCHKLLEKGRQVQSMVETAGGWTDQARFLSRNLYDLLACIEQQEELSKNGVNIQNIHFLEPYSKPDSLLADQIIPCFEHVMFTTAVLSFNDAVAADFFPLVWSASFVLPEFVDKSFTRPLCNTVVLRHLSNIAEALNDMKCGSVASLLHSSTVQQDLFDVLRSVYDHMECATTDISSSPITNLDDLSGAALIEELKDRPIIYTGKTGQMVKPDRACIRLSVADEIPPFLHSIPSQLVASEKCKTLFRRLGCMSRMTAESYANLLAKFARVCKGDYLNSNEIRKVLKAMNGFFRSVANVPSNAGLQFSGLFLLANNLKMQRACEVVLMDQRQHFNYATKLADMFLFNPNECVIKLDDLPNLNAGSTSFNKANQRNPVAEVSCLDKIFVSQRPSMFSEKYEETFSVVIPEDIQRQRVFHALERKYNQLLNSRTLHRCIARALADAMARSKSDMRIVPVDEMEMLIRSRIALLRVTCCQYLEVALCLKANQQRLDQTVEERAVMLTDGPKSQQRMEDGMVEETYLTLHISFKHAEQAYFPLCLAKAIMPLFLDMRSHLDQSVLSSLIASSIGQMSRLLDMLGMCTDDNILPTLKLNYVPSPGRLYGDEVSLLTGFASTPYRLIPGDLCVFRRVDDSALVYCSFVRMGSNPGTVVVLAGEDDRHVDPVSDTASLSSENSSLRSSPARTVSSDPQSSDGSFFIETEIAVDNFFLLENWGRVHEAVEASPIDEKDFAQAGKPTANETSAENSNGGSLSDLSEEERSELDFAKSLVDSELRELYFQIGSDSMDKKKRIKKLLLKWHPDKNQGKEKFASEVFKYLRKQVELYDIEQPQGGLGSSFSSLFTNYNWSYNAAKPNMGDAANHGFSSSRFGGSYDNIHKTNGHGEHSPTTPRHSPPGFSTTDDNGLGSTHIPGSSSPPGRSSSFRTAREEWQWRRQQGFSRRAGFFNEDREPTQSDPSVSGAASGDDRRKPWTPNNHHYHQSQQYPSQQLAEAQRWLKQAYCDLNSAGNDIAPPPPAAPSYEWVCYKCHRATEKGLKAYHLCRCSGKLVATDIPTLLFGVDNEIRSIGYRLYKWLGDPNKMQYPGVARFTKTPSESFTATQAEKSIEYTRELLKKVEDSLLHTDT